MLTLDRDMSSSSSSIIHHQMLGLPIVEAVSLEKRQDWSGCAIHTSVIEKIGPKIVWLDPIMVSLYDVPMSKKHNDSGTDSMKMYAVNIKMRLVLKTGRILLKLSLKRYLCKNNCKYCWMGYCIAFNYPHFPMLNQILI
jgi:hypothetical protein